MVDFLGHQPVVQGTDFPGRLGCIDGESWEFCSQQGKTGERNHGDTSDKSTGQWTSGMNEHGFGWISDGLTREVAIAKLI
jgi:hypothetical protein